MAPTGLALAALSNWLLLPHTAAAVSLRQSMLCEARTRLGVWYKDQDRLESPKERDGVSLQITRHNVECGGNHVPVTFGNFDVDAEPHDVFNALADTTAEGKWDSLIGSVTQLGDFPEEAARGVAISYAAHPFSDREVFEWQVFDGKTSGDDVDLWVVFTTQANGALHKKKEREGGAVAAQDCLAAYRVQRKEGGGAHVTFTSHVNSHPFLLSSSFVFNIMWGKTVDYINALRSRAQQLASDRQGSAAKVEVPEWLFTPEPEPTIKAPFSCDAAPQSLFELPGEGKSSVLGRLPSWPFLLLPGLIVAGMAAAFGPGRRIWRSLSRREQFERQLNVPLPEEAVSRDLEVEQLLTATARSTASTAATNV